MAKKLTWITFALVLFGLAMISSAGIFESQRNFGTNYHFLTRQLRFGFIIGTVSFLVLSRINYRHLAKFSLPLLLISIGFLVMLFVPGFGVSARGATRWLDTTYFSFQPSEVLKLTLILYLAAWFSKNISTKRTSPLVPFFVILGFIALLLSAQPDIGTLGVIFGVAIIMFFVAGAQFKKVLGILAAGVLLVLLLAFMIPNKIDRVLAYLNPDFDPAGISYHVKQSIMTIGSGGFFGAGFGKGTQKAGFLPEPVGDSIFSVIVEELGFVGASAVLGAFSFLLVCLIMVAKRTTNAFAKLTVTGIFSLIVIQVLVNVSAVSGLLPFTGITLPFISYGSSSLATMMASMGIAVRIAKELKE